MAAQVELKLIGEKALHNGANPLLVAYCPSMELLALGSSDQQVSLYRLNGQRVYNVAQKGTSLAVNRICWKPNGNSP
jgi:anaphase-promoting complex subunit 4